MSRKQPLCTSTRPPKDWSPLKVGGYGFVGRVGEAAMNGGADWADVWQMILRLGFDVKLSDALAEALPAARRRTAADQAIDIINAGKLVTPEERDAIVALDASLRERYPVKSHRYDAIDLQRNYRHGRARYILEGPRKRKKK